MKACLRPGGAAGVPVAAAAVAAPTAACPAGDGKPVKPCTCDKSRCTWHTSRRREQYRLFGQRIPLLAGTGSIPAAARCCQLLRGALPAVDPFDSLTQPHMS